MPASNFLNKLRQAPRASFHVLDPAKAKHLNAATLYIPSPEDVTQTISDIPEGETRTIQFKPSLFRKIGFPTLIPN